MADLFNRSGTSEDARVAALEASQAAQNVLIAAKADQSALAAEIAATDAEQTAQDAAIALKANQTALDAEVTARTAADAARLADRTYHAPKATVADNGKFATVNATGQIVWGDVASQTGQLAGSAATFAGLPSVPADASATIKYHAWLTADDIGTGDADNPQYPQGLYVPDAAFTAWELAIATSVNIAELTAADVVSVVGDAAYTKFGLVSPERLDTYINDRRPLVDMDILAWPVDSKPVVDRAIRATVDQTLVLTDVPAETGVNYFVVLEPNADLTVTGIGVISNTGANPELIHLVSTGTAAEVERIGGNATDATATNDAWVSNNNSLLVVLAGDTINGDNATTWLGTALERSIVYIQEAEESGATAITTANQVLGAGSIDKIYLREGTTWTDISAGTIPAATYTVNKQINDIYLRQIGGDATGVVSPLHVASFNRSGAVAPSGGVVRLSDANQNSYDPESLRSGTTSLIIKSAGRYLITFCGNFSSTGARGNASIRVNNVIIAQSNGDSGSGDSPYATVSAISNLSVADVLTFGQSLNMDHYNITVNQIPSGQIIVPDTVAIENSGVADGDALVWNDTNQRYEPQTLAIPQARIHVYTRQNAGTWVTCGSIRFRMSTSGNRSFKVRSASGTIAARWVTWGSWAFTRLNGVTNSSSSATRTLTVSSDIYLHDGLTMGAHNDKQSGKIEDVTNGRRYQFDLFVGSGYNNNVFWVTEL